MSGVKRRTKYRKKVTEETYEDIRDLREGECILQIVGSRGGNQFEVLTESGESSIAILPRKFKNLIWVKRGDFVLSESANAKYVVAGGEYGKVNYLITHILQPSQISNLCTQGVWPLLFNGERTLPEPSGADAAADSIAVESPSEETNTGEENEEDELMNMNPNRRVIYLSSSSEEEDDE